MMMTNPREVLSAWSSVTKPCYTQPWKLWWTKTCGSWLQEPQVTSHIAESEVLIIATRL